MNNLQISADRLWQSLMTMAQIGATERGGCCRLALTDLDRQGRDLFIQWCKEAGCSIRVDKMGNIFARREGRDPNLPPVMTGSHLDTQPTGGKYDGVFGVLAGLEVLRTLNDFAITTDAPVEVVCWTNEEGARFPPAMVGSGVFAGAFDVDYGHSRRDPDGVSLGQALEDIGYLGSEPCEPRPIRAFFEAHIEQGPILEAEGCTIGVVTGAQGVCWSEVVFQGAEAHAGTTPMNRRRDALQGAARLVTAVRRIALEHSPDGVGTVGVLQARPGSRNTIPGEVFCTVDLRHPGAEALAAMQSALEEEVHTVARDEALVAQLDVVWRADPIRFDDSCVDAVRRGARQAGLQHREIVSGAGHDACHLNRIAPTAMVFIPCEDGISHNEAENAMPEDLAAGCGVLLHAMLEYCYA